MSGIEAKLMSEQENSTNIHWAEGAAQRPSRFIIDSACDDHLAGENRW